MRPSPRVELHRQGRCDVQRGVVELEVSVREAGEVRIVDARGRLTIGDASDRLHRELQRLAENGWHKILVNLTDVQKIDSTGISTLVRNCISLSRAGGSLRLVCPAGRVHEALNVTRLVESIPTFNDEASALASFD